MMNIGIDLDNTITEIPEFFSTLTNSFLKAGHRIFIITYRDELDRPKTMEELDTYGIAYDHLIMLPPNTRLQPGPWKGQIAREVDLDIMIDDAPEVIKEMPKKVKTIWFFDKSIFNIDACILGIKASPKIGTI